VVYDPSRDVDKLAFLAELGDLRLMHVGPWLLVSDFNMIYQSEHKNNNRLNRRLMGQFRRLFTWSNERAHLMLQHIDRAFVSTGWEDLYPNHGL
jgi:hypothetical protein